MDNFLQLRQNIIRKTFSKMNDMQFEAVVSVKGPLLILAGAGSGKTTVLVNRIVNLIRYGDAYESELTYKKVEEGDIIKMKQFLDGDNTVLPEIEDLLRFDCVRPWNILAITFTNKAASELKSRIEAAVGEGGSDVFASTFHAFCSRILRKESLTLGFTSHFTIYDTDDSQRAMKQVMKALSIDEKTLGHKAILHEISRAKDSLISPDEYNKNAGNDRRAQLIGSAYKRYQALLQASDAMDFDDIIVYTVKLFRESSEILSYYQDRFKYIMVDEYQDTNHAQYILTKLLAEKYGNICVVGDDDQSIYRFRGATIRNILDFEKNFSDTKIIRLEQNYRSTAHILNAANNVISNNFERKGKELWTDNGEGDKIYCKTTYDEQAEAQFVANTITDSAASGKKWNDHVILYRMNAQSNNIERALVRSGIPYRIIGGHRFYDRKEIKDAIAYLSLIVNTSDDIRLMRIINEPKRGIGDSSIAAIRDIAYAQNMSMFEAIKSAKDFPSLSRSLPKLLSFAAMIERFRKESETLPPHELLRLILNETAYIDSIAQNEPEKYEDRLANLDELASNLVRFFEENPEAGLRNFLEDVTLMSDIDNYNADSDTVILMTLHSAKGLEFPVCFIIGMEEGVFPGVQSMYDPGNIEEERRLAYVGITRAKEKLYLVNAGTRMLYGSTSHNRLSRFVTEIPNELKHIDNDMAYSSGSAFSNAVSGYSYGSEPSVEARPFRSASASGNDSFPKINSSPSANSVFQSAASTISGIQKNEAPLDSYKPGDTVNHKKFGIGVVVKADSVGNDVLLEIAFQETGTKKLMARMARLEKL